MLVLLPISCKTPTTPTDENDPWEYGGEIEIMYVRILPVVNPNGSDPKGASIYHWKYGGKNSSSFVLIGENAWIASVGLECDGASYSIQTVDMKISTVYTCVGKKFFLRPKKEGAQWVELTCIVADPSCGSNGQAAEFIFNHGQVKNPY